MCTTLVEKAVLRMSSKVETPCFLGAHFWCSSKEIAAKCDVSDERRSRVCRGGIRLLVSSYG